MGFGIVAMTGCICALAYMNAMAENRKEYTVLQDDGSLKYRKKISKWD